MVNELLPSPRGSTKVGATIGDPIEHSLSPAIHNAAFAATGLDWVYVAFRVPSEDLADAISGIRALGLGGFSVTMPHKEAIIPYLDSIDPVARALSAVNAVAVRGNKLEGYNTDGPGLVAALRTEGHEVEGKSVVVLGAGGAGRACVKGLADAGASAITVVARRWKPAEHAAALAGERGGIGSIESVSGADIVINATPVGMDGVKPGERLEGLADRLSRSQVVVDLVYNPLKTPFLADAEAVGAIAVPGLGMLVHQAALAFELFTGVTAPVDAMMAAVTQR